MIDVLVVAGTGYRNTVAGVRVREVAEPSDALRELREVWPDVLLLVLDRDAEEMALVARAARRRADRDQRQLKIVFVRGDETLIDTVEEAEELGADDLVEGEPQAVLEGLVPPPSSTSGPLVVAPPPGSLPTLNRDWRDRAHLQEKLDQVRYRDYFEILEVQRDTSVEAIAISYRRIRSRFEAESSPGTIEVLDGLDDAWRVLGSARRRAAYLESLSAIEAK